MCLLGTLDVLPLEKQISILIFKATKDQCASFLSAQILAQIDV